MGLLVTNPFWFHLHKNVDFTFHPEGVLWTRDPTPAASFWDAASAGKEAVGVTAAPWEGPRLCPFVQGSVHFHYHLLSGHRFCFFILFGAHWDCRVCVFVSYMLETVTYSLFKHDY